MLIELYACKQCFIKGKGHKVIPLRASREQVPIWDNIEIGLAGYKTTSKYEEIEFFVIRKKKKIPINTVILLLIKTALTEV